MRQIRHSLSLQEGNPSFPRAPLGVFDKPLD